MEYILMDKSHVEAIADLEQQCFAIIAKWL